MLKKTALMFMHDRLVGAGRLPSLLKEHGFAVQTRFTPEESLDDIDPLAADLLVVLGGPKGAMAVYEIANFPFLQDEIDAVKARADAGRAVLGICLGAQILAHALGARVYPGPAGREIGWRDLHLTPAGQAHPARHLGTGTRKIMQWHGDTFDLPPGAALLASSDMYDNQIFAHGKCLAIQCHPEAMKEQAARWIEKLDDRQARADGETLEEARERLLNDTMQYADGLGERTSAFMKDWLRSIGLA